MVNKQTYERVKKVILSSYILVLFVVVTKLFYHKTKQDCIKKK